MCSIMYTDAEIKKKAKWKLCDMCSIIYIEIESFSFINKALFYFTFSL